jgi:hypothetical protein
VRVSGADFSGTTVELGESNKNAACAGVSTPISNVAAAMANDFWIGVINRSLRSSEKLSRRGINRQGNLGDLGNRGAT